jgi:PEP-CTERM/exosortase A-associated glycosyltransferase
MDGMKLERSGQEAFQRRDYELALRLLREALASERFRPSVWLWLSRTQLALEDSESALSSIEKYLELDPFSPRGIFQLVAVLRKQGEREQSIQLLVALAPNHVEEPEILRSIVNRLLGLEAFEQAAEAAEWLLAHYPGDLDAVVAKAIAMANQESIQQAEALIEAELANQPHQAALARSRVSLFLDIPVAAWAAVETLSAEHVSASHIITTAQRLMQQGHGSLAESAADRALRLAPDDRDITRKRDGIVGEVRLLRGAWTPPTWVGQPESPIPGRVLHVVGASAPYRQTGYTVRTQSIVRAQQDAGMIPEVVTPLGFPWTDGVNEAELVEDRDGIAHYRLAPFDGIWGLPYSRTSVMKGMPTRPDDRLTENAHRLAILARERRPAVLHAASDFHNGLLALTVGRFLGVPVVYEVRGFWQESWLSRSSANTTEAEIYQWRTQRELECCLNADQVVTLAKVMKQELVDTGVPPEKILVVPNAVDVDAFVPVPRNAALAARLGIAPGETVLGYISSMVSYEGIQFLIDATHRLLAAGEKVRTLLVGDGTDRPRLEAHAAALGIADRVIFTGRVPHAEVLHYYALLDVFVVPRTSDRVSRLVTPLKPYEAMAAGRAVVVSAVPALEEMVMPGQTGLTFRPEDADHLAAVLTPLLANRARREELGHAARAWVRQHRTWHENARRYRELYQSLGAAIEPQKADADQEAIVY